MNAVRYEDMVQGMTIQQLAGVQGFSAPQYAEPKPPQANLPEQAGAQVAEMSAISFGLGALTGGASFATDALNMYNAFQNVELAAAAVDEGNQGKGSQQGAVATVEGAQVTSSLAEPQRISPANGTMADIRRAMNSNPSGIQFTRNNVANQPSVEQRMKSGFSFTVTNGEQKLDITKLSRLEQYDAMRNKPELRVAGMRP